MFPVDNYRFRKGKDEIGDVSTIGIAWFRLSSDFIFIHSFIQSFSHSVIQSFSRLHIYRIIYILSQRMISGA